MIQNAFFKDLVVVELASVLAGPAIGMFFAELGARVIKIENKTTDGDVTRRWKLPSEPKNTAYSAYYCSVNWNKEVHLLDFNEEKDKQGVYNLIKNADIVISNFKDSSAQKLGMDYAFLKQINPKLIYAQLYAFGKGIEKPAFDVVLQAEAGFLYMNGPKEGDPVKMPVALIDLLAAHQLKEGILLALLHRERTGKGSFVWTSLLESAIASLANQATNWLVAGHIPQRMGTEHPNIAPYGDMFRTKDGKAIVLAVGTERQFAGLCDSLGLQDLVQDERFSTNKNRVENRQELYEILEASIRRQMGNELLNSLNDGSVPVGEIRNMKDVFETKEAQALMLKKTMPDGTDFISVKTAVFRVED